jgi:hypothetical protein
LNVNRWHTLDWNGSTSIALEIARRFLVTRCKSGMAAKKSRIEAIADV